MDHATGSWLCPTEADRARMLEAGRRVRDTRLWVAIGAGAAMVACAPWSGWWPVAFALAAVTQLATLERRVNRSARPERYVALSFAFTAITIAASAAVTGGPASPLLPLLSLPTMLMANRFRRVVVVVGLAAMVILLLLATLAAHTDATLEDPQHVLVCAAILVGIAIFTLSLSDTEMKLREQSRFDHLTGLLNRAALAPRFEELRGQAEATGASVAVIVYDLDHFKSVNDELGHDVGDVVLRDTAVQLRRHLRAFDLVYRLGGEEFAVVLPGVGARGAYEIAERQRRAVEQARPGGVDITISGGVASARGEAVVWDDLYRRADSALLRAKRQGRNRVLRDDDGESVPPPSPAPQLV
jgi:diguanylate cyclase (GGDEF)-like protein